MNGPRVEYLARHRDRMEKLCIECVQQAVNEQAPDPIARVGELLLLQSSMQQLRNTPASELALRVEVLEARLALANARIAELEGGADVDAADEETGLTPLMDAARNGQLAVVESLLAKGAQAGRARKDGNTALTLAAQNGYETVVAALLAKGAQADVAMRDGATALLMSSMQGHGAVVAELLEGGAQADLANKYGVTPLFIASEKGHEAVVAALLANGAQAELAVRRVTPLMIAQHHGHTRIVAMLTANTPE
jgi:ankyrin repeat protein